ncbi:Efflux pump [Lachnellula subtilissima]|uniref:Efflux pump n=1 Tax=Lachnellula subtilissima TaxID=602034 RepID=A0A8H8UDR1_9HELO|nr:Efflux pump [Lachnellula subtilissima]
MLHEMGDGKSPTVCVDQVKLETSNSSSFDKDISGGGIDLTKSSLEIQESANNTIQATSPGQLDSENASNEKDMAVVEAGSAPPPSSELKRPEGVTLLLLTVGLMFSVFIMSLDTSIIATAVPKISTEFHSIDQIGWYTSAYLLPLMALQPTFGKIYSYFDIKTVFLAALLGFEVGSVVCATAKSSVVFIVGRAIAGSSAGAIHSGAFGGIAAAIFLLGFRSPVMKPSKLTFRQKLIEMDITGTVLFVSSMTCLFLALQWGGTNYAWSSSKVWGLILGSGLLFAAFITLQLHLGERATIPLRIFRNRSLSLSLLTSALLYFGLTVHTFYLPFYFQSAKGTSAASSGLRMLPYIVTFSVTQMVIGSAVTILGVYLPFMWTGSAIFTVGAGLISSLKTTSDIGHPIGYQILAGYGFGSSMQLCATAVRASVSDRKDIPISSALTIFAPFFGGSLAAAVAQNIFRVELVRTLQHSAVAGNTTAIVAAGATSGQNVVPVVLKGIVREAYSFAVSRTFLLAVASGGLAFLCTLGIEWKNLKRAAKQDKTEGRGLNETKGVTISVQEKS